MSSKYCKGCGKKIPRKIPNTGKKTAKYRKYCYNCSPIKALSHPSSERTERRKRKEKLVQILGGRCSACGYDTSIRALSFHHICPSNKLFDISSNGNLMKDWEVVLAEAKKCKLLCLNCHAEFNEHEIRSANKVIGKK